MMSSPSELNRELNPKTPRAPLSRKKRVLFGAIIVLSIYLFCEFVALATLSVAYDGWSAVLAQQARESRVDPPDVWGRATKRTYELIHPYLGYVFKPDLPDEKNSGAIRTANPLGLHVNEHGFVDNGPSIRKRSENTFIVAILGGSVGQQVAEAGSDAIRLELEQSPGLKGKNVEFVRLAVRGYKQPQQLLVITYLLSIGAEFDAVVNLDGFNEIAQPWHTQFPAHIHSSYPRSWKTHVAESGDMELLQSAGRIAYTQQACREWSQQFSAIPWRFSPLMALVWNLRFDSYQRQIVREHDQLHTTQDLTMNLKFGPAEEYLNDNVAFDELVARWSRASFQLHSMCDAQGIRYYHFLQPNQYVRDSKPMLSQERAKIYRPELPSGVAALKGYPRLIETGKHLRGKGVRFFDITQIFHERREPIYIDSCCHYNDLGIKLVGQEIGRIIREDMLHAGD